jgi:hypothetical protein
MECPPQAPAKLLLAQPMVAEEVAVIAGEHDQRVIPASVALQKIEQPPELIIDCLIRPMYVGITFNRTESREKLRLSSCWRNAW